MFEEQQKQGQLAPGWEASIDVASGQEYFFHRERGLSRWDRPTSEEEVPYSASPPLPGGGMNPLFIHSSSSVDDVMKTRGKGRFYGCKPRTILLVTCCIVVCLSLSIFVLSFSRVQSSDAVVQDLVPSPINGPEGLPIF